MLEGMFSTSYQRLMYDLTDEDNYLRNATFTESMEGWTAENDTTILTQNGEPLTINGALVSTTGRQAVIEEYEGRNMLHMNNSSISQANADIRKPGTHKEYRVSEDGTMGDEYEEVKDTLYLTVKILAKTDGELTIGMDGATPDVGSLPAPATVAVTASTDWQTLQWSGTWDGAGDFVMEYTGEMYVALLSLTDKPLEEYKKETQTKLEQTSEYIRMTGGRVDTLSGEVSQLGIELDAAENKIQLYIDKTDELEETTTQLGIRLDGAEDDISLYARRTSANETAISDLEITTESISSTVESNKADADGKITACNSKIEQTAASITATVESNKTAAAAAAKAAQDRADEAYSRAGSAGSAAAAAQSAANSAQSAADSAQSTADSAYSKATANATAIAQNATSISAIAGRFDSEGHLIEGSGWVTTSNFSSLYSRVQTVEGTLAAKAEASTSVQYDPSTGKVTSNIKLTADKISLEGVTTINSSFRVDADGTTRIGGFTVDGGRLEWKSKDYFSNDSRSLKLGVSETATEGVVDVSFNGNTTGRFGVKAVGSNFGGAAIYGSAGTLTYPATAMTFAGFFVGAVDVRDTANGISSDVCASLQFRAITARNSNGTYTYRKGISFKQTYDLDEVRIEVVNGIIVGLYKDNGTAIITG